MIGLCKPYLAILYWSERQGTRTIFEFETPEERAAWKPPGPGRVDCFDFVFSYDQERKADAPLG